MEQCLVGKGRCLHNDHYHTMQHGWYRVVGSRLRLATITYQASVQMASPSDKDPEPGSDIRNTRTTHAFRAINFELFAKPVSPESRCILVWQSGLI